MDVFRKKIAREIDHQKHQIFLGNEFQVFFDRYFQNNIDKDA